MQTEEERKRVHREAQNRYHQSPAGKETERRYRRTEKYRIASLNSNNRLKEKQWIWRMVHRAKRDGILLKHVCEVCGGKNAVAHHDDYTKPLEVRWFCVLHHAQYHKILNAEKNKI